MALTPAEYQTRISGLHASYENRYRFPDWCTGEKYLDLHDKFCQTARLVAPQDQKRQARLSIYQRQPVNIMMNTSGTNWKAFKQLQKNLPNKLGWGWENSYYTTVFIKWRILAVNVAVYCETPVSDTYSTLSPHFLTIRVLNLVGLGFDTSEQPDHQAFVQKNYAKPDKEAAKKWLQPHVTSQLQKVEAVLNWAHTSNQPIRYMHLPAVGCGHFAGNMPIRDVWDDLSKEAVLKWEKAWPSLHVDTRDKMYVGKSAGMHTKWRELDKEHGLRHCLFVNAWDPHSFIGNGNLADESLDGWYGRFTAMAVLGWPGTNPYLLRDDHFIDSPPVAARAKGAKQGWVEFGSGGHASVRMPMADFMDDADDILLAATPTKTTGKTKHRKAKVPTKPKMVVTAKKLAKAETKKTSKSNDADYRRRGAKILAEPYRPGCTSECYRMSKKERVNRQRQKTEKTEKTAEKANMERWLRKQKREYLIGLQSDLE